MRVDAFVRALGADFFTGVPDSQLKALCDCLMSRYGVDPKRHVIAANEGCAAALAAGYHLATGKTPVIYLQNSGEGNLVNPAASLLHEKVYAIPAMLVVGWRGEPGVHDEPQHRYQGEITLRLLEDLGIDAFVLSPDTSEEALAARLAAWQPRLAAGRSVAIVVRKGALTDGPLVRYGNGFALSREEAVRRVIAVSGDDPIVSTTGKASRELFELRAAAGEGHQRDFLTVGSMGHSSSIALGIAIHRPERRVWCVDGDGAALMHMGAMAVIGSVRPRNLVHVLINNGAHETVGGMPTVACQTDMPAVARACGYPSAVRVDSADALDEALRRARDGGELAFIEVLTRLGSRPDLGRPTTAPRENKEAFMAHLRREQPGTGAPSSTDKGALNHDAEHG